MDELSMNLAMTRFYGRSLAGEQVMGIVL